MEVIDKSTARITDVPNTAMLYQRKADWECGLALVNQLLVQPRDAFGKHGIAQTVSRRLVPRRPTAELGQVAQVRTFRIVGCRHGKALAVHEFVGEIVQPVHVRFRHVTLPCTAHGATHLAVHVKLHVAVAVEELGVGLQVEEVCLPVRIHARQGEVDDAALHAMRVTRARPAPIARAHQ